jgi:UDP-2-acetamido-3-amino-2,3-dideoxy-glucuronate N-acetyltransferase
MSPPIHPCGPHSVCLSGQVGSGTEIGSFVAIAEGVRIGSGCRIGSRTVLEADVCLGNRVVLEGGSHLFAGVVIEDDVFVGNNTTFATARAMAGTVPSDSSILLRSHCRIGANVTLCPGIVIGEYTIVDAGAVVTQSVQPHAIVSGNPAQVIGFVNTPERSVATAGPPVPCNTIESKVRGVRAYHLPFISDPRGNLTVGEFERTLPFTPKRYFITFDVPSAKLRGEHAHWKCEQFLICVRGSCAVVVDDGSQREEFLLDRPTFGVYVPAMIWATEYKHSPDSTLMVFSSEYYDPDDYIRDYHEFLAAKEKS